MNDLELYIYIALALIYFLSRAFRKKKPANPPTQPRQSAPGRQDEEAPHREKPLTFEDLLREFTGAKNEPEERYEEEVSTFDEYDDDLPDEEKESPATETYGYDSESPYKNYEEIYGSSESLKTLDEQVKIGTPERKRFEGYKIEESENIHIAKRYRDIFAVFNKHKDKISRVTFWGLHDGISWKNNFPIFGRTDYPLIFDREMKPKKAYWELIRLAEEKTK